MSVRSARKHDGALSECVRRGQRVSTTCWMGTIPIRIMNMEDVKTFWLRLQRGQQKVIQIGFKDSRRILFFSFRGL